VGGRGEKGHKYCMHIWINEKNISKNKKRTAMW
jgi:hypothetical protein